MTQSKNTPPAQAENQAYRSQHRQPTENYIPPLARIPEHIDNGKRSSDGNPALLKAQINAIEHDFGVKVEHFHKAHVAAEKREDSLHQVKEEEIRKFSLVERTEMEKTADLQRQLLSNESAARIRMIEQGRERKVMEKEAVRKTTVNIGGVDVDREWLNRHFT